MADDNGACQLSADNVRSHNASQLIRECLTGEIGDGSDREDHSATLINAAYCGGEQADSVDRGQAFNKKLGGLLGWNRPICFDRNEIFNAVSSSQRSGILQGRFSAGTNFAGEKI